MMKKLTVLAAVTVAAAAFGAPPRPAPGSSGERSAASVCPVETGSAAETCLQQTGSAPAAEASCA